MEGDYPKEGKKTAAEPTTLSIVTREKRVAKTRYLFKGDEIYFLNDDGEYKLCSTTHLINVGALLKLVTRQDHPAPNYYLTADEIPEELRLRPVNPVEIAVQEPATIHV